MTEKQPSQQPCPQNFQPYYEDETNFIDYLRVIWKWKWLISAGTLICAITAAFISLQMPKIYEISTVIKPGIAGVKDSGGFTYIDSATNISGKIDGGVYSKKIEYALQLDPLETRVEFKSAIIKKTNMIKVTSQWQAGDTDIGAKAVRQMIDFLSSDYSKISEQKKGYYNNQILMKQNEISKVETQRKDIDEQIQLKLSSIEGMKCNIRQQEATLEVVRQRKGELLEEIKAVKKNTEKIIQQRDVLLKDKSPNKDLALLLYATTIQQNVAYFNQLNNQIYNLDTSEKKIEAEVDKLNMNIADSKTGIERLNLSKNEGLQAKIYDIKAQINTLELENSLISNIKIIQEPEVSLYPVKPKKKLIVLLAGFISLFMFVLLTSFIEYIRNASKEEQGNE